MFPYVWHWNPTPFRIDRKGQRCRILSEGKLNSVLVEFTDGFKVITSRHAVRLVGGSAQQPQFDFQ